VSWQPRAAVELLEEEIKVAKTERERASWLVK